MKENGIWSQPAVRKPASVAVRDAGPALDSQEAEGSAPLFFISCAATVVTPALDPRPSSVDTFPFPNLDLRARRLVERGAQSLGKLSSLFGPTPACRPPA